MSGLPRAETARGIGNGASAIHGRRHGLANRIQRHRGRTVCRPRACPVFSTAILLLEPRNEAWTLRPLSVTAYACVAQFTMTS
jgi:hypothetical protein